MLELSTGKPIRVTLPDGGSIRLAWDPDDGGLTVIGDTVSGDKLAQFITIQPRAANRVVIGVS